MLRWLIGIILGEIICDSSNWQHIQRLKITILGANWQLFRLERIAKFSYFILSTQNIKFYWFVMKIKKFLLPIWWYNRGLFPLRNKYFGVFVLNGLNRGGGGAFHETCHHWQFVIHWLLPWQQSVTVLHSQSKYKNVTLLVSEWQIVSDDKFHDIPPPPPRLLQS